MQKGIFQVSSAILLSCCFFGWAQEPAPQPGFGFEVEVIIENRSDHIWKGKLSTSQDSEPWGSPVTISTGDVRVSFPAGKGEIPISIEANSSQRLTLRGIDYASGGFLIVEPNLGLCCDGFEVTLSYRLLDGAERHLGDHLKNENWVFPQEADSAPNLGLGWKLRRYELQSWLDISAMKADGTQTYRSIRLMLNDRPR